MALLFKTVSTLATLATLAKKSFREFFVNELCFVVLCGAFAMVVQSVDDIINQ
jgi:hypothetical protein